MNTQKNKYIPSSNTQVYNKQPTMELCWPRYSSWLAFLNKKKQLKIQFIFKSRLK